MYDISIIGAGPAGISASLYAVRANMKVLVVYNGESNLEKAHKVDNYYGFVGGIRGKDLFENGINQAKELGVDLKKDEVIAIKKNVDGYTVETANEEINSKVVIISTGNRKIAPNIKGIKEFEGRGISYCAICDAFFYRKKNIAVIGEGEFAISEGKTLENVTNSVTILTNGKKINAKENTFNTIDKKIKEIVGKNKVQKVVFEDDTELEIDGVFIALGEAGAGDFAKTLGIIQEGENIKVNNDMETNVSGIYACGNITGGLQQVCKAVYEGAMAGLSAVKYIKGGK